MNATAPAGLGLDGPDVTSAWLWLITAWLVNYAGSVAPAFAPPSWALLATFRILGRPPLIALGVGGSLFGALGKATLAWGARKGSRFLDGTHRENVKALMAPLEKRPRARVAFTAVYSLGPFPSNLLFIAVGAGGRSIREAALQNFTGGHLALANYTL